MNNLELKIYRDPKQVQVNVSGSITSMDAFDLKEALADVVSRGQELILDLTNVKDISLTGLNALLMTQVRLNKQNSKLTIIAERESRFFEYLHLTKMTSEFEIVKTSAKSLAA